MTADSRCMRVPSLPRTTTTLLAGIGAMWLMTACNLPPAGSPDRVRGSDRITASDESAGSKRARVRMQLATGYFERGQLTTALDEVKLAIQADPTMGDAYNLRGLIYAALGDTAIAEDSFRHAIEINPRDGDSMHNLGWFLCQQRRYPEATALFSRALVLPQYPGVSRTLLGRGVCEARAGQWTDAEATLVRAHTIDPANPVVAVNLAEVLYQRGDYERARFYVKRIGTEVQQSSAQNLWLVARIENKLGNQAATNELGQQLRNRFPQSRESSAFERGAFDEQ
jgi:type IV pilus assembly protein PilF